MTEQLLYRADEWLIFVMVLGLALGATEAGFRLGRRGRSGIDAAAHAQIGTIQASVLGVLALLLGFSFAMAASRFDVRKQLVLDESNAIGTALLRARLLPEPHGREIAMLLRQYVDARLAFYQAGIDPAKRRMANDNTAQLHERLWREAATVAAQDHHAVITGLFVQTLGDVIDLHAKRVAALENHVPGNIFLLLYFSVAAAMGLTGYSCGMAGARNLAATVTVSLLITAVILLIVDLDRPQRGLIQVGQQSLIDLRNSLPENGLTSRE